MQSWVRVEWEVEPEEWMMSAAIAFDAALQICNTPDGFDLSDKTVVRVSVFKESERQARKRGTTVPPPEAGQNEIIASPMVRKVSTKPVLQTALGNWLVSQKLSSKILVAVVCLIVGIYSVNPGVTNFDISDTVSHNTETVSVIKPQLYTLLSHCCLYCCAVYLVYHMVSKDLLRLAVGFDCAAIVIGCAMREVAMLHEIVKNYMVANEPLPSIDVVFYVTRSILNVIGHFTVSVADAWTLPIRGKLSVLIPLIITLAIHYLKQRFFCLVEQKRDVLSWRVYYHAVGVLVLYEDRIGLLPQAFTALPQRAFICRAEFQSHRP